MLFQYVRASKPILSKIALPKKERIQESKSIQRALSTEQHRAIRALHPKDWHELRTALASSRTMMKNPSAAMLAMDTKSSHSGCHGICARDSCLGCSAIDNVVCAALKEGFVPLGVEACLPGGGTAVTELGSTRAAMAVSKCIIFAEGDEVSHTRYDNILE